MSLFFYINKGWRVGFGIELQPHVVRSILEFEFVNEIYSNNYFYLIIY
jgi:hypothetical protein